MRATDFKFGRDVRNSVTGNNFKYLRKVFVSSLPKGGKTFSQLNSRVVPVGISS